MKTLITASLLSLVFSYGFSQEAKRFEEEVKTLSESISSNQSKKPIIFTGSSSVRMWKTANDDFPKQEVINTGFGGSQMSDLLYYADQLILAVKPGKIFIYEGDNDISAGKKPDEILKSADSLLMTIRKNLPQNVNVYFLSAKPSLARWNLKEEFESYNRDLKVWTDSKRKVFYVDVWSPMIGSDGNVLNDLFIADGLHMNEKGYAIWKKVLEPFIVE